MATTLTTPAKLDLLLQSADATWNRARWELLGDDGSRYEVIDGVLYMSSAPRPVHQLVSRLAERELYEQIDNRGIGITLHARIGLFMPGCDPVQPDLLVIRTEDFAIIGQEGIEGVPALLVEILSPSNRNYDLLTKRVVYARAGVPEYWIFRPQERDVLVHSDPEPATGLYRQVQHFPTAGELVSPTLPFRAPVAAFFPELPLVLQREFVEAVEGATSADAKTGPSGRPKAVSAIQA